MRWKRNAMNCSGRAAWLGSKRDQGLRELPPHAVIAQFLTKQKSVKPEKIKLMAITHLTSTTITDEDKLKSRDLLLFSHFCICIVEDLESVKMQRKEGERKKKLKKKKNSS